VELSKPIVLRTISVLHVVHYEEKLVDSSYPFGGPTGQDGRNGSSVHIRERLQSMFEAMDPSAFPPIHTDRCGHIDGSLNYASKAIPHTSDMNVENCIVVDKK
jgi:hypothetical protein